MISPKKKLDVGGPCSTSSPKRLFTARSADLENINAQAKNAQAILRRWTSSHWRPTIVAFREADPAVVKNPCVDILPIAPNHLWYSRLFLAYLKHYDAI